MALSSAERSKAYALRHPERRKEHRRRYNQSNREKLSAQHRAYMQAHKVELSKKRYIYVLKKKYGLTPESYEALATKQGRACAICREVPHGVGRAGLLHVDHAHATGKVRGLLCDRCNLTIGKFKDSSELLRNAANYLEQVQ